MPRVTTAFAATLSLLLPFGRPLLVGLTPVVGIGAGLLSTQHAYAQTAEDWIVSGNQKYINDDNQGAIADYTKAIEIKPDLFAAYNNRGLARQYVMGDLEGACSDWRKAAELGDEQAAQWVEARC